MGSTRLGVDHFNDPRLDVYPRCGSLTKGENEKMEQQKCRQKTEVYSRVVGYFRPLVQWDAGKQSEFKDRRTFNIPGEAGGNDAVEKDKIPAEIEQETQKPESDQATRPVVIDQEIDDWYEEIGAMKT